MLGLNIKIHNVNEVVRTVGKDIDKVAQELAYRIVDEARQLMDESTPAGRVYRRGGFTRRNKFDGQRASGRGSRFHRASAPGQPPAEDSGKTYRDIHVRQV